MKFSVRTNNVSPDLMMKKAGYARHRTTYTPQTPVFVKSLRSGDFPRFHVFIYMQTLGFDLDIHLDWRRPLHRKEAHSSENDTPVVRAEAARIHQIAAEMAVAAKAVDTPAGGGNAEPPTKKGIFGRLFG